MSADLSLSISMRGNPEELAAMLKVLRSFETEKRTQYRTSRDCGYIESVKVAGNASFCSPKQMTDAEIVAFAETAGEALNVTAMGPWGAFFEPGEVGLFEALADAATGAWFSGQITGFITGADVAHGGELKNGLLHLFDYMVADEQFPELYVKDTKKKLSHAKFCKLFHVDKGEFDKECYEDFLTEAIDFGFPNDMDYDSFMDACDCAEIDEEEFESAMEKVRELGIEDFDTFRDNIDESPFTREHVYDPNDPGNKCEGLTFVITGKVTTFKNREEFTGYVERQGGKVTGSISKNTNYLVNNDSTSSSSKNKKAAELGIPVITEAEFIEKFGC